MPITQDDLDNYLKRQRVTAGDEGELSDLPTIRGEQLAEWTRKMFTRKPGQPGRDCFNRFTERARKVLSLAHEEAQRLKHNYIGTEHLFLGLIRERDGVAGRALSSPGIDLEQARSRVEAAIGKGDKIALGEVGLTPRAKKVIELAVDEAHRMYRHYIGTEHLLLGMLREGEGVAIGVLENMGLTRE